MLREEEVEVMLGTIEEEGVLEGVEVVHHQL